MYTDTLWLVIRIAAAVNVNAMVLLFPFISGSRIIVGKSIKVLLSENQCYCGQDRNSRELEDG